jgi:hypothetical protein
MISYKFLVAASLLVAGAATAHAQTCVGNTVEVKNTGMKTAKPVNTSTAFDQVRAQSYNAYAGPPRPAGPRGGGITPRAAARRPPNPRTPLRGPPPARPAPGGARLRAAARAHAPARHCCHILRPHTPHPSGARPRAARARGPPAAGPPASQPRPSASSPPRPAGWRAAAL